MHIDNAPYLPDQKNGQGKSLFDNNILTKTWSVLPNCEINVIRRIFNLFYTVHQLIEQIRTQHGAKTGLDCTIRVNL